ncbi:MAG: glycosyltransferase family 2 protein [Anaerolineaceae bacterium]|nr:MAG: glycosyltransferase family 2 protein [Anaerolineaceae bacterium]
MTVEMVSIIIPAYNVEKYLEECLESVINQTYKNIEIILINDGSTDSTGKICEKWTKRDSRIKYISKQNEGLSATRNMGLYNAKGKYVFFLDSDDWIALYAIEELLKLAEAKQADVVAADYIEVDDKTRLSKRINRSKLINELIETDLDRSIYLQYGVVMVWAKLYRKNFLLDNNLYMPSIPHEDNAIFPMIAFLSNKIINCDEAIYYYRINRSGSIVSDYRSRIYLVDACEHFMDYFIGLNLVSKYYSSLKRYSETRIYFAYNLCSDKMGLAYVEKYFLPKIIDFYNRYFNNSKRLWEYSFWLLGSFSSRWIIHQIGIDKNQLDYHLPFSSLIAQMSEGTNGDITIVNNDLFRRDVIWKDFKGELLHSLIENNNKPDFFVIDFLEERYDVGRLEDGNYITLSEAYYDSDVKGMKLIEIIKAGSGEHMILWRQKCNEFISYLKRNPNRKIILIKSRLALKYDNGQEYAYYENCKELENTNIMIEKMETYFTRNIGMDVQIYDMPKQDVYTPKEFKYGIHPEYWNQEVYKKMIAKLRVSFDKY